MLAGVLGSETRARLIALLVAEPQRGFHMRELIRQVATGTSGVQREIARFDALGVVSTEFDERGRRVVRLAEDSPLASALGGLVAAEARATYGSATPYTSATAHCVSDLVGVNPNAARYVAAVVAACRSAGASRVTLFGSATQPDRSVTPRDLDVMVRMPGPARGSAERHLALKAELESATGMPIDLVDERAVTNRFLRLEIERTGVVILETA